MLSDSDKTRIGRQLRAMYEDIPKGGIPDRIWKLLLAIERKFDFGHALRAGLSQADQKHGRTGPT